MDPSQARKDTSQARLDSILSYWGKSFKIPRAQNGVAAFGRIPNHHFMGLGLMRAARYLPPECVCVLPAWRDKSPFEHCVENRHLDVHQPIQPTALRAATTPPPRTTTRFEDVRSVD